MQNGLENRNATERIKPWTKCLKYKCKKFAREKVFCCDESFLPILSLVEAKVLQMFKCLTNAIYISNQKMILIPSIQKIVET